ncbi:MAG: sugar ABC transporter ATP-binding protein [Rhodobacterales bacterium RIFCSPHIGHO2_02_FULL_62_130]|jgi:multiple sugar transport system ATP-binding protein|nr:MAG: sugar ABC transporter ATP-binding protein [Rhodobacterales bacterium RIFCSPHIGHO2_02_FULL_62_130]OHC55679.1 MAG: sugar ABC transporter ATP-binding protein [Rhodobacterales bacterium RIFCSPHIGHO2_12_FULL_62_75]HCZ01044.1 sugar ABC transporter ATP-binding protein [Rhodobacter sp.]
MSSVTIRGVKKRYGAMPILHGIDLEIRDQEFVVLVGPSGCGKSTLLRMIAGLETVSSGDILIGERVINDVPPKSRDIAMVFQNYALYPHMSVYENMSFSLRLRRQAKEIIDRKVREAAEILNLTKFLDRSPRQLSGGQRQRVAMGRALVRDAEVFLFDEPLSNLDAKLRVVMRTEIKALHQRLKTTSVYVTHDQIEAMTMADRIVVMNAGRIEQIGTPLELYDTPANLFVADFIGSPSMNVIRGVLGAEAGRAFVELPDGARLFVPAMASGKPGQKVVFGARPEHCALAQGDAGVAVQVEVVEPTGANIQVYTKLAGAPFCAIFTERHDFRPGQTIRLDFPANKIHLFDAETGARL